MIRRSRIAQVGDKWDILSSEPMLKDRNIPLCDSTTHMEFCLLWYIVERRVIIYDNIITAGAKIQSPAHEYGSIPTISEGNKRSYLLKKLLYRRNFKQSQIFSGGREKEKMTMTNIIKYLITILAVNYIQFYS